MGYELVQMNHNDDTVAPNTVKAEYVLFCNMNVKLCKLSKALSVNNMVWLFLANTLLFILSSVR